MSERLTKAKLADLKSEIPHCEPVAGLSSEYVSVFSQPRNDHKCLCCGGDGTFTWGLAHGEGHCYECGWPARLYHFIKNADGKEERIVALLQYHPDQISLNAQ